MSIEKLKKGELSQSQFMAFFGHLRPGTFEIESPRYDEKPDIYFSVDDKTNFKSHNNDKFEFDVIEKKKMEKELSKLGINIGFQQFIKFVELSIKGREYSKFIFSRSK